LRIENERLAGLQQDRPGGKLADTNLRPLQVGHDADGAPGSLGHQTQRFHSQPMIVGRAVGKIQPHDIHAGCHQLGQPDFAARRRAERSDDFGGALQHAMPL
jgi:hypothetical protein